jgi:hypothetical protein
VQQLVFRLIFWGAAGSLEPDLGFVDMRVAVAPPLARRVAARGERHEVARRRWRREVLVHVAVGRNGHGRAALGADAEDVVRAGHILRGGGEVQPLAIARPGVELLAAIVEGDALERARRELQHVDIAAAGAVGNKRQARAIGRVERPRFHRRMRHQQMRFPTPEGRGPDISA